MWPPATFTSPSFFLFLPSNTVTPSLSHRPLFNPPPTQFRFHRRSHLSRSSSDDLNGWAILDTRVQPVITRQKAAGFPSYAIVGVGTSLALLLALFGSFSLSRKGFNVQLTSPLQAMWSPTGTREHHNKVAEELHTSDEATPEAVIETVTPC